jgi:hypothetical protein
LRSPFSPKNIGNNADLNVLNTGRLGNFSNEKGGDLMKKVDAP